MVSRFYLCEVMVVPILVYLMTEILFISYFLGVKLIAPFVSPNLLYIG